MNGFDLFVLGTMAYAIYWLTKLVITESGREWLRENW